MASSLASSRAKAIPYAFVTGLVFLGLGWNFSYVGGGTLLTERAPHQQRHVWQGINDTAIASCATLGAFLPAPLLILLGWSGRNALSLFLCLSVGVVCWFSLSRKRKMAPMMEGLS